MPGTLFLVATPIGNLEDVTLRALRVLKEAAVIAAEDTRRTARLLARFGISTPTLSFHEHNARGRLPQLLDRLRAGQSVALVTDAGTPGVSDPGVELVQACVAADIPVEPVPGPSAPLAAVVASGFPVVPLTIMGFVPNKSRERARWLSEVSLIPHTVTFFDAPHRIKTTLADAQEWLGVRPLVLARELTKVHQQFLRGTAAELLAGLGEPKGEFTVVVGPKRVEEAFDLPVTDEDIVTEFGNMPENSGLSHGQRVGALARRLGKPRREVYAALERTKYSVK
jgi:16S rRNA (cytidine1402-2'-O)-methyltransferase